MLILKVFETGVRLVQSNQNVAMRYVAAKDPRVKKLLCTYYTIITIIIIIIIINNLPAYYEFIIAMKNTKHRYIVIFEDARRVIRMHYYICYFTHD